MLCAKVSRHLPQYPSSTAWELRGGLSSTSDQRVRFNSKEMIYSFEVVEWKFFFAANWISSSLDSFRWMRFSFIIMKRTFIKCIYCIIFRFIFHLKNKRFYIGFSRNFNQLVLRNEYSMFILVVVNSCQIIGFFFYNDTYYVCKKFDFTTWRKELMIQKLGFKCFNYSLALLRIIGTRQKTVPTRVQQLMLLLLIAHR